MGLSCSVMFVTVSSLFAQPIESIRSVMWGGDVQENVQSRDSQTLRNLKENERCGHVNAIVIATHEVMQVIPVKVEDRLV